MENFLNAEKSEKTMPLY